MSGPEFYPEEPAGDFPVPPRTITDEGGRSIGIERLDWRADQEKLVAFYRAFDPADRAQGLPPVGADRIRRWLTELEDGYDVVARDDETVVGHATLVPDDAGGYELAIFVLQAYQGAGIGKELLRTVLGLGQAQDVDRVWLTVERWNHAAVHIYETAGFETTDAANFELEMSIRI
ncbi:MAG: N-acetyltransferase family protein [Halobacteriaceae archaeon]